MRLKMKLNDENITVPLFSALDDCLLEVTTDDGRKISGYSEAEQFELVLRPHFHGNPIGPFARIDYNDIEAVEVY